MSRRSSRCAPTTGRRCRAEVRRSKGQPRSELGADRRLAAPAPASRSRASSAPKNTLTFAAKYENQHPIWDGYYPYELTGPAGRGFLPGFGLPSAADWAPLNSNGRVLDHESTRRTAGVLPREVLQPQHPAHPDLGHQLPRATSRSSRSRCAINGRRTRASSSTSASARTAPTTSSARTFPLSPDPGNPSGRRSVRDHAPVPSAARFRAAHRRRVPDGSERLSARRLRPFGRVPERADRGHAGQPLQLQLVPEHPGARHEGKPILSRMR